jgi:SNF2 family DNA or RNA helicase
MKRFDFCNLLSLCGGNKLKNAYLEPLNIDKRKLKSHITVEMSETNGRASVSLNTPIEGVPDANQFYIISSHSAWVYDDVVGFVGLDNPLPLPYHSIYKEPIIIERDNVFTFLSTELPALEKMLDVQSDISMDMFEVVPEVPVFELEIRGSLASIKVILHVQYGDYDSIKACELVGKDAFTRPDPDDLYKFIGRNLPAEKFASSLLQKEMNCVTYVCPTGHATGRRAVLNFVSGSMPFFKRQGWKIRLEGRIADYLEESNYVTPVVSVDDTDDNTIDISFKFEDSDGESITMGDVQRAINMGESFISKNGNITLLDTEAVSSMLNVFADCSTMGSSTPGHFRMSNIYSGFVAASLNALDGIDIDQTREWQNSSQLINRTIEMVQETLPGNLDKILRPYQKSGVNWLSFMEKSGFSGILADDMGLGKTIQTLTWIAISRQKRNANTPALIVGPTSLAENWYDECQKFVPYLKVFIYKGAKRHDYWDKLDEYDIVVTSYGTLRVDAEKMASREFDMLILDEAQHIKNHKTSNAKTVKSIMASYRLALTGTPIENGVSDLWSIMDFLMPGYLGDYKTFKTNYDVPVETEGADIIAAHSMLRRKVHPFLLRRLKKDVAKDLPAKIQKIQYCRLTKDQEIAYKTFMDESRNKVSKLISQKGFGGAQMEILTILLRLRQICCHMELIDSLKQLNSKHPSAKMELFKELLSEAIDGGHRILVFSQFTSMLGLLRDDLEKQGIKYCYLDGKTKHRVSLVKKFNMDKSIPVFLISLKAGGTGLNLTGADMVLHFDPWWNPAVEEQATDRAHRIGQKKTVYSIKLITKDTIEEKVLKLQQKKKALINATIESGGQMVEKLSLDDVKDLLNL